VATKLFLRSTQTIITGYYDLLSTAGAAADTCVTNTTGAQVQLTKTAGGSAVAWITRAVGVGFTLTLADISLWQQESNALANAYGRFRLFKYASATGVETELGGGPFDDDVEMSKPTIREDTWAANPTDTAFARGDRVVLKCYLGANVTGYNCTMSFNAADGATGDSFLNINETITFLDRVVVSHY